MRLLRIILVIYALLIIIGGVTLLHYVRGTWWYILVTAYILINASVLFYGALFERKRYIQKSNTKEGWQKTNERFTDPSTGKLMEVHYNPKTGERRYQEVHDKK